MEKIKELLLDIIIRLTQKSPNLFIKIQWLITIITLLITILTILPENTLPLYLEPYLGKNSIIIGILAYILAKLPVQNTSKKNNKISYFLKKD